MQVMFDTLCSLFSERNPDDIINKTFEQLSFFFNSPAILLIM